MLEVRRGADRFVTRAEGRTTWHSFSFGSHYDPGNVGFGPLVAHNDELLPPATGYPDHHHADVEIVTWVRSGSLHHTSSAGTGVVGPGRVQRLSAGSGVVHSEVAEGPTGVRFVQAWLRPDREGPEPGYLVADVPDRPGWVCVADGSGRGVVPLAVPGAALHRARLGAGEPLELPAAPLVHLFVTQGSLRLGERTLLGTDDAARLTDEPARPLAATSAAEVLVWSFGR